MFLLKDINSCFFLKKYILQSDFKFMLYITK